MKYALATFKDNTIAPLEAIPAEYGEPDKLFEKHGFEVRYYEQHDVAILCHEDAEGDIDFEEEMFVIEDILVDL